MLSASSNPATSPGRAVALPQMKALDRYWETTSKDRDTGLFRWHDQLESGCDNLITSECPSTLGTGPPANEPCWVRVSPGGCTVLSGPCRAALTR